MKLYIKNRIRRKDEFQFFMHQFVEECIRQGFTPKADILPTYRFFIRSIIRRVLTFIYRCLHRYCNFRRKEALLITANGGTITDELFPYYWGYEITPFLWDCWPYSWETLKNCIKLYDIKLVFITSSQVAERVQKELKINAIWIPEGIDDSEYRNELKLKNRPYDIFEMGRHMPKLHEYLKQMDEQDLIKGFHSSSITKSGTLDRNNLSFTNEEVKQIMSKSKIMICFPQCDTNPQRAGNIETLTQRYWEAMLSGCIMLGRAPEELIKVIGYNPVVEICWEAPIEQISEILNNIESYQTLIDKNFEFAKEHASWRYRIPEIKHILISHGYTL